MKLNVVNEKYQNEVIILVENLHFPREFRKNTSIVLLRTTFPAACFRLIEFSLKAPRRPFLAGLLACLLLQVRNTKMCCCKSKQQEGKLIMVN